MPGEWSPYFGKPTEQKDMLWDQLYTGNLLLDYLDLPRVSTDQTLVGTGILLFTPEETKRMPNQTVAVPGTEGDSGIYDLEVFHELHCLV